MAFITDRVKVFHKSEFENTVVFSGVQGCTWIDLEFSYFYIQYFKLSEIVKVYLQNSA